jgi:hypothetical protein
MENLINNMNYTHGQSLNHSLKISNKEHTVENIKTEIFN